MISRFVHESFPALFISLSDVELSSFFDGGSLAPLQMHDESDIPAHLHTLVTSRWNEHALFVFFRGNYLSLRCAEKSFPTDEHSGKTFRLWEQSDVFEFFVGPNAKKTKRYKEFQVAPDGRWLDVSIMHGENGMHADFEWRSGFHSRVEIDSRQRLWCCAMEIPWSSLEIGPHSDEPIHCNFYRASGAFHGEELLAWAPTGSGEQCFHRVERFGTLIIRHRK